MVAQAEATRDVRIRLMIENQRLDEFRKMGTAAQQAGRQVDDLKKKIAEQGKAAQQGFAAAAGGAMKFAGGLAILGAAGGEDLQKIVKNLALVGGTINAISGSAQLFGSLTAGLKSYAAASAAAAAANTGLAAAQSKVAAGLATVAAGASAVVSLLAAPVAIAAGITYAIDREGVQGAWESVKRANEDPRAAMAQRRAEGFIEGSRRASVQSGLDVSRRAMDEQVAGLRDSIAFRGPENERAAAAAQGAVARNLQEQVDLQTKLADLDRQKATSGFQTGQLEQQRVDTAKQLADSANRAVQLEMQRIDAMRQQGQLAVARIQQERDAIDAQLKGQQQIIANEQARLKDLKATYGLMSGTDRLKTAAVAEKLTTGKTLTREEQDFAGGNALLAPALKEYAVKMAEQDGKFDKLIAQLGQDVALKQAQSAAQKLETLKVEMTQQIEATINLNEATLAQELTNKLLPKIQEASQRAADVATRQLQQEQALRDAAQRAGGK